MNQPQISVLIPTHNYARYLPEAIESVLAQDFEDFELLIADDASTDGSADVIARYAARDQRIRQHVHPGNVGMVENWNWCLSQARGDYIKFLFGDDKFAHRSALGRLTELLKTYPSAVLASSARFSIDENSKISGVANEIRPGLHHGRSIIARCIGFYGNMIGEPSVVMFRKRDAQRGFDPAYRQLVDVEMWLHLLENGDLVYTSEPLTCFRRHWLQQTEVINSSGFLGRRESAALFWEFYNKPYIKSFGFRRLLFKQWHEVKKTLRRCPDVLPLEQEMFLRMGGFWFCLLWMHYTVTRPVHNLRRWVRKQVAGRSMGQEMAMQLPRAVQCQADDHASLEHDRPR